MALRYSLVANRQGVGIAGGMEKFPKFNNRGGWKFRNIGAKFGSKNTLILPFLYTIWYNHTIHSSKCRLFQRMFYKIMTNKRFLYTKSWLRFLLGEKLIGGGVGIRMSWVEKFRKINQRGGTSIRDRRVFFRTHFYMNTMEACFRKLKIVSVFVNYLGFFFSVT